MADDDDQGTSSGSRPKLLLPKAPGSIPGPAQPLSHVASRHRKKLDAALSAGPNWICIRWVSPANAWLRREAGVAAPLFEV